MIFCVERLRDFSHSFTHSLRLHDFFSPKVVLFFLWRGCGIFLCGEVRDFFCGGCMIFYMDRLHDLFC